MLTLLGLCDTPQVFVDGSGTMQHVVEEVQRARQLICAECGRYGVSDMTQLFYHGLPCLPLVHRSDTHHVYCDLCCPLSG